MTLEADRRIKAIKEALVMHDKPKLIYTDHGDRSTSPDFIEGLARSGERDWHESQCLHAITCG
ncbi:hypothetical protein J4E08_00275 [Sagittula sp. NFXS13]